MFCLLRNQAKSILAADLAQGKTAKTERLVGNANWVADIAGM